MAAEPGPAEEAWRAHLQGRDADLPGLLSRAGFGSPRADWVAALAGFGGDATPVSDAHALSLDDPEAAREAWLALLDGASPDLELLARERAAIIDLDFRRNAEASDGLTRCLALADSLGRPVAAAHAHLNLGRARLRSRDIDGAEPLLQAAVRDCAALGLDQWRGDAALNISVVHRLRMDLDATLAWRETAYEAYTAAGHLPGRARSLHFAGTTRVMMGDLTRGLLQLREAETLAREAGDDDVLSGCLGDQAGVHYLIGDFELALGRYEEAAALARDPRRVGWYESNMGSILGSMGRHEDALAHHRRALEIARETGDTATEAGMLYTMGLNLCDLERFDESLEALDRAVAVAREHGQALDEAAALQGKGHTLLDAGRLDEAAAVLAEAVVLARATGYFDMVESALIGQARTARRQGRLADALAHLEDAAATVLEVRRSSGGSAAVQSGYLSEVGRTFDEMVDVLWEMHAADPAAGHDRRAWHEAQRGRARSLLDMLDEAEVDLRLRADPTFREREAAILEAIAGLESRREAAPDSADALAAMIRDQEVHLGTLEAELRAADPRYAELRYPRPVDLDRLRTEVLGEGEAVLEYQLGAEHSHLWLITRDRFVMKRLPPRVDVEARIRDLLPMLRDPNVTGDAAAWFLPSARGVASMVLDPVRNELGGVTRLVVVPDGLLHYLPFAALPVEDSDAATFAGAPWLIRRLEVTTTPSVSALDRLRSAAPVTAGSPLLLLGDPEMPGPEAGVLVRAAGADRLQPTPAARSEFDGLLEIYGRAAHAWAGAEATAERLSARPAAGGGWRSVHLATHGVFNEERPRYSGLVLSPAADDDGFVSVDEIFALDLDCEQVVLSACSTALGEVVDGEGLEGLTRAFLYAGARSVVAALWDVSGDGAARFMRDYHARLAAAPDGSRTAALCAAQRALATDAEGRTAGLTSAHPAFWAAFSATGDAR